MSCAFCLARREDEAGAAAGIAMINSIGNPGGFVGPVAIGWLKNQTGSYASRLYVVGTTLAISAVVTLLLSRKASEPVLPQVKHDHRCAPGLRPDLPSLPVISLFARGRNLAASLIRALSRRSSLRTAQDPASYDAAGPRTTLAGTVARRDCQHSRNSEFIL